MENKSIQAISTYYNGHWFRSRLEAKWAVFFDYLNLPYHYEWEGYKRLDDGLCYLPDFWLFPHYYQQACDDRNAGFWVEIKKQWPPSSQECAKSIMLLEGQDMCWPACILGGDVWPFSYKGVVYTVEKTALPYFYKDMWYPPLSEESRKRILSSSSDIHWHSSTEYIFSYSDSMEELSVFGDIHRGFEGHYITFQYCSYCRITTLKRWLYPECPQCKRNMDYNAPILWDAFSFARQARFEYKQNPLQFFCSSCPIRDKDVYRSLKQRGQSSYNNFKEPRKYD